MSRINEKRVTGQERRKMILSYLQSADQPVTGNELAGRMNVSRQVIVQDISLIKAQRLPIIATSRGYLYLGKQKQEMKTRTIVCRHSIEDTARELTLIVECGVTVVNVTVEHPLYGEITGSLMIANRSDVAHFIGKLHSTGASLLSSLTGGVHLHLLEAPYSRQIDNAVQALKKAGILI
ncbi:MAG: transcription repressor NadR [Sporolactobacillus sp.]|jgi:transcriptional regulator of NAD metabolism|nr:transcription repressor NadR [Sporolactobacillus sp.]MCI1881190.1 transcription repressor NadR [Sporolactobacillus sp.]